MAPESDVAQLRRGDLEALSTLLTRYQNRLYRYLLRMVRQPAEAEDLFQQTWLRVAEKIQQYDPRRTFEAWLFTLARNLAIDHLRRVRPQSLDEPIGDAAQGETGATRLLSRRSAADRRNSPARTLATPGSGAGNAAGSAARSADAAF